MVALRAVENGYAIIRPSRESASVAYDGFGRELARTEWVGVAEPAARATVTTAAASTLYSRIGDLFAYAMACALVGLLVLAVLRTSRDAGSD